MLLLLALLPSVFAGGCLYDSCPKHDENKLNLHIVCHTHDDMGWLKTVDQYYYGMKKDTQNAGVQYILNTVVQQLLEDPTKRFTYVETGFFKRWWDEQNDMRRHAIKKLVNDGQLEFVNGGWTMNDEAASHYVDTIEQMSFGMRKLNDSFGACGNPRVGWQIDPFGHSREQASLYTMLGFDAMYFARIHYLDHKKRMFERKLEMIWKSSNDFDGDAGQIFTGAFFEEHYGPPPGFCFDDRCDDTPLADDNRLDEYNIDDKVKLILAYAHAQSIFTRSNHIMFLMGSDFQYMNANQWYTNLDKLIQKINEGSNAGLHNVTAFYSTPTCYTKAKHDAGLKWSVKTDDFFPYANNKHSYWTGYFTSRPTMKGFVRKMSSTLQVCKNLDALAGIGAEEESDVEKIQQAQSLLQHHDAVSGTAKQNVSYDYYKRLHNGLMECQLVINDAMKKLTTETTSYTLCPLINETRCKVSQDANDFTVTVFNGMSRKRTANVRIPLSGSNFKTIDPGIPAQVQKVFKTPQLMDTSPADSQADYEMILTMDLPALGFAQAKVAKTNAQKLQRRARVSAGSQVNIANENIRLDFDSSGRLSTFTDLASAKTYSMRQDFLYYMSAINETQPSGAYVFRPNGTDATQVNTGNVKIQVVQGTVVSEVWQTFDSWLTQVVRLYKGSKHAEFEWTVGPIPVDEKTKTGAEIVTRITTDMGVDVNTFYTDANGRQIMERKRDYQSTYTVEPKYEPIASNYYPVNSRIFIKNDTTMIGVLTDRSQGGTAFNGTIELMIHRRCLLDDHFGVGEPLNETGANGLGLVARGRHWLFVAPAGDAGVFQHRSEAEEMFYDPLVAFTDNTKSANFAGLTADLPPNVKVLTLEQKHTGLVLLRLEHTFQKNEHSEYSKSVTVKLQNLFSTFTVTSVEELGLGGDRKLSDIQRLHWQADTNELFDLQPAMIVDESPNNEFEITLNPMEIRTFHCVVERKKTAGDSNTEAEL